ncbi:MAG TPA: response regulator, partial [Acidimicrobiales bacterium]|nr:response regulator [Acidimicrobiales bacterium]
MARHRHEDIRNDLPAYAVGALEEDQRATVERHLEGCTMCRAELDELVEAAGALLEPKGPPPPAVWDRVSSAFRRRPELAAEGRARPAQIAVGLVDTEVAVRARWRDELEPEGDIEIVGEADDGLRAVELARLQRPDVMVLELALPRLSGLDAIPRIVESSPATRILACS